MRDCPSLPRRLPLAAYLPAALAAALLLGGCSLLSLKSPERPLSARDLNTRVLTRQFAAELDAAVEECADQIATASAEPAVRRNALRWKLATLSGSAHAATQLAPSMALLDTWAFTAQMKAFLGPGAPGGALFGTQQARAQQLAGQYADQAESMAQRLLLPGDFARFRAFVDDYTREFPLADLRFARPSVVQLWVEKQGADIPIVASLGTIPEALADTSDRLQMLTQTLPDQSLWRGQLALADAGVSAEDVHSALRRLDERLERLSLAAENSPQLVHAAVNDVRRSLLEVLGRLDASSAETLKTLRTEREALSDSLSRERAQVITAADAERQAVAGDVERISGEVVKSAGQELRRIALEATVLVIVLALVLLGLPFAAGYFLGRARGARRSAG